MSRAALLTVHPSQFPGQVRSDLLESLRSRQLNHKFLYDGINQTQKWLALHEACSPARTDPDCATVYDKSFEAAIPLISAASVHLVGLGCGGGQKDARLLALLKQARKQIAYSPMDVSAAMVLVARENALAVLNADQCFPAVLDLSTAADLANFVNDSCLPDHARLFTLFGMLPNFEPERILPQLARVVRPDDFLLLSANLAPGDDYEKGVVHVLPLYDNDLTRDWLMSFLLSLGVQHSDGHIRFVIEDRPPGLKRIAAFFDFHFKREIKVHGQLFAFSPGNSIRLFYSYRHTPSLLANLLARHGLKITGQWITKSHEEGVFLVSAGAAKRS